jgi:hypothetical protein
MPDPIAFDGPRLMSTLRVRVAMRRLRAALRSQKLVNRMRQRATRIGIEFSRN